ncbi:MAG: hypothetical protein WDZ40_01255 [Candidatus Spechtbacterales bacterium]
MAEIFVKGDISLEKYFEADGKLAEIKRQLRQKGGYPKDIDALISHLQLAVEGEFTAPRFKRDMSKEAGWTLGSDVGFEPAISSVDQLELVQFFNYGEDYISGEELEKRAKKLNANFGHKHAEWLLENQNKIPESWRQTFLPFPGTIWWDLNGNRRVSRLLWAHGLWHLGFSLLDNGFYSHQRLLRLSK